jgi:predicted metal-binding membrane protein
MLNGVPEVTPTFRIIEIMSTIVGETDQAGPTFAVNSGRAQEKVVQGTKLALPLVISTTEQQTDGKVFDTKVDADMLLPSLLYVAGWLLMLAAIILPATLPLLQRFDRTVVRRDRAGLLGLLTAGCLVAWASFRIAAHLLDRALHLVLRQSSWFLRNSGMLARKPCVVETNRPNDM